MIRCELYTHGEGGEHLVVQIENIDQQKWNCHNVSQDRPISLRNSSLTSFRRFVESSKFISWRHFSTCVAMRRATPLIILRHISRSVVKMTGELSLPGFLMPITLKVLQMSVSLCTVRWALLTNEELGLRPATVPHHALREVSL
jgi:hypothetical protein